VHVRLGAWPTAEALVDDLARAFAEAAAQEDEPECGRLRAAAEQVGGGLRDVAVQAAAARLGQL
jgi:hypothetical protein